MDAPTPRRSPEVPRGQGLSPGELTALAHEAMDRLVAALLALSQQDTRGSADQLLSVREAATRLGVGRSLLYEELRQGRIRSLKVGRRRLIPASAITERSSPNRGV